VTSSQVGLPSSGASAEPLIPAHPVLCSQQTPACFHHTRAPPAAVLPTA
jgi:hypothetical protein